MRFIHDGIVNFNANAMTQGDGVNPITTDPNDTANSGDLGNNFTQMFGMLMLFMLFAYAMQHTFQNTFKRVNGAPNDEPRRDQGGVN